MTDAVLDRALGRQVRHDPRSLNYPAATAPPRKVIHSLRGDVLDQGTVGACTAFATCHALNSGQLRSTIWHRSRARLLRAGDALDIYSAATQLDPWPGSYPPDDTGSSGLAAAQAAQARGLISRYEWAFGIDHVIGALQLAPVLFGATWHYDMLSPDAKGNIRPTGGPIGGHETVLFGWLDDEQVALGLNSWGPRWGRRGYGAPGGVFRLTRGDLATLLEDQGDATVLAA
jgi:hypothetical protein